MEPISRYEIRDELRRVLASRQFAKTRKRNRFLEFICEQAILGNGDKLNEYLIGVEVYERGEDFNPQEDAIVRVQASEIRKSLRDYYTSDGKEDPWRIELPAGHYVPSFTRGPVIPPEPAAYVPPVDGKPPAPVRPAYLRRHALVLALGALCAALTVALLWERLSGPPPAAKLPPSAAWFWKPFLPPAEPPLIVLPNHPLLRPAHDGDSPATLEHGHLIPKSKLGEFRDKVHFRELKEFHFVPDSTDFTGFGEALGLLDFFELFSRLGQRMQLKPERLVDFDSLKRGNAIILGGTQGWSGRIFFYAEGFSLHAGVIENKNPQPGEQAIYRPAFDSVSNALRRDYALVLMLPNMNRDQRILLTYGIYTKGTQAAIEYVTNPESLEDLRNRLTALTPGKKEPPRFFQVLLATTVENDVPGRASFVSARVVPDQADAVSQQSPRY
jgi:hypothetical protein